MFPEMRDSQNSSGWVEITIELDCELVRGRGLSVYKPVRPEREWQVS